MELTTKIKQLIEENECKFVSFKYIGKNENLSQIDIPISRFLQEKDYWQEYSLKPIEDKIFIDPFRSMPTVSIFCYQDKFLVPDNISKQTNNPTKARISFWIIDDEANNTRPALNLIDPFDIYSNLRADIASMLEQINIKVNCHYHGNDKGESVIEIESANLLKLADDILVSRFIINNCAASYNSIISFDVGEKINLTLVNVSNDIKKQLKVISDAKIYKEVIEI